ncbi:carbonyl reductase NADPH 1-like [Arapaima gigas]
MSKKVAVVTGANKGIGLAVVRALCRAPFPGDVLLTARNEQLGRAAVEQLRGEGLQAAFHQLDICDQGSVKRLAAFLQDTYGGIDLLVNNAGIAFKSAACLAPPRGAELKFCKYVLTCVLVAENAVEPFGEQAEVTMRTNFWGTLWVSQALLPLLRPHARVVNISSFASQRALGECSPELQANQRKGKSEGKRKSRVDRVIELQEAPRSGGKVGGGLSLIRSALRIPPGLF